jgi:choice-of-anchor A domain-containing protein
MFRIQHHRIVPVSSLSAELCSRVATAIGHSRGSLGHWRQCAENHSGTFSVCGPSARLVHATLLVVPLLAVLCLTPASADAGILSDWNLLVATDVTTTSHVDGSAKIGGNLTANGGIVSMQVVTAPGNTGLAVGGNISAGNLQINNGGNVRLQGSQSGTVLFNGGGTTIADPTVTASVAAVFAYLESLSVMLSEFVPNGTLDNGGNLNAVPTLLDGQLVAIYNLSTADFTGKGQLNLNFGTAQTVILNVTSPTGIVNLQAPPNLIGGFSQNNSNRILWNFSNATEISVNNTFNGALLAPHADLIALGGGLNGTVAVHSLSNHNAEIRRFNYTGYVPPVPEPAGNVLAGMAVLMMIPWACRRNSRKDRPADLRRRRAGSEAESQPGFFYRLAPKAA